MLLSLMIFILSWKLHSIGSSWLEYDDYENAYDPTFDINWRYPYMTRDYEAIDTNEYQNTDETMLAKKYPKPGENEYPKPNEIMDANEYLKSIMAHSLQTMNYLAMTMKFVVKIVKDLEAKIKGEYIDSKPNS